MMILWRRSSIPLDARLKVDPWFCVYDWEAATTGVKKGRLDDDFAEYEHSRWMMISASDNSFQTHY